MEGAYFAETQSLATDPELVGFTSPKIGSWSKRSLSRYAFFFAPDVVVQPTHPEAKRIDTLPPLAGGEPGLHGKCPACDLILVCAADLDGDPGLDVWSMSLRDDRVVGGRQIPAGELLHEWDDSTDKPFSANR